LRSQQRNLGIFCSIKETKKCKRGKYQKKDKKESNPTVEEEEEGYSVYLQQ
jgi:hypothetical protein